MHPRYLVPTLTLAFVLVSCNDSKAPTEPLISDQPSQAQAPNLAFKGIKPSEANPAAAAVAAVHDPKRIGMRVRCFSGTTDGGFNGTCRRTTLDNLDLAELNTFDGDDNPNNAYAGVWAVPIQIRGKRLGDVVELSYQYAGGPPSGGSPRWSVAIDENGNGTFDYPAEQYAFADVNGCNDGDGFVGTEDGEDDGSCIWSYKAETFPNWDSFAGAHPSYRIPRRNTDGSAIVPAFVIIDQPGHYLVFKFDVR